MSRFEDTGVTFYEDDREKGPFTIRIGVTSEFVSDIDPDWKRAWPPGKVEVVEYLVAHDCGTVINPLIVKGQLEGGVAQGIGGALYESFHYDEFGNPLAASFLDYHIPTAVEIPRMRIEHFESPAPEMPWRAKGAGEAGIIGPAPAIAAAVENALVAMDIPEISQTPISAPLIFGMIRNVGTELG